MQIIVIIIALIALYVLGVVIPNAVNEKFSANYGDVVWSNGVAIIEGVSLAALLLFMEEDGLLFWIPLIFTVLSYAFGIWSSYEKAKFYGAGIGQAFLGVLAQVLASGSLAFVILFIIAIFLGFDKKKKRRH